MFKRKFCLLLVLLSAVVSADRVEIVNDDLVVENLKEENLINEQQYAQYNRDLSYLKFKDQLKSPQRVPGGTAVINGRVVNNALVPVSGHTVVLYTVAAGNRQVADSTTTDPNGEYDFTGLGTDNYAVSTGTAEDEYIDYIWQSAANGGPQVCNQCAVTANNQFMLVDATTKTNVDFTINLGGTLTGTLLENGSSVPVATLNPTVFNTSGNNDYYLAATVNTTTGVYSIKGMPDGNYRMYLSANYFATPNFHIPQVYGGPQCNSCYSLVSSGVGSVLTIAAANTVNNVDFMLNLGASISGKVVDALTMNPLKELAFVMVFDELNYNLASFYMFGTNTDPNATGDYTIGGLLPGSYYVQGGDLGREFYQRELFNNRPCYYSGCDRGMGDAVVLSAGQNKMGVNFLLEKGGKISGIVVSQSTGLPFAPVDGEQTQVEFYDSSEKVVGSAFVASDGTYESARALPAGNYAVRTGSMFVGSLTTPYVNQKYLNVDCPGVACDLTTADVMVNNEAVTSNIDFELSTGFSFSGTITDVSTGNPIPNVYVLVYKDMGVGQTPKFANWATTGDGVNSPLGQFVVQGLSPGSYYARTNNGSNLPFFASGLRPFPAGGWIDILHNGMPCPGNCDVSQGTPIVVGIPRRGGDPLVDFSLNPGATISGRVIGYNNGLPIPQIQVNVYDAQGDFMGSFETNSNGEFLTVGFQAGTYYLTTSSYDVLVDVTYGNENCMASSCNPLDGTPVVLGELELKEGVNFVLKSDFVFGNGLESTTIN